MSKRILIVGGVGGGATIATRLRRLDPDSEIIIFDKGPNVSFANCSLPYYLGGIIKESESLLAVTPEKFKDKYNITALVKHEVTSINPIDKTIEVKNLNSNDISTESYDYLVLSPGARPIMPKIPGINSPHLFKVQNVDDAVRIKNYIKENDAKNIAIIGGGLIGIEVAENLRLAGCEVTIIEAKNQILSNFDYELAEILQNEMLEKGVSLVLEDGVTKINEDSIEVNSGKVLATDLVIMAVGIRPETNLAKEAGLAIGETGGIKVNAYYQTSDPSIYAIGDAAEVFNMITKKPTRLAMAFPAHVQARAAANHIYGHEDKNKGFIGSMCVKIFDYNAAATGLNETSAREAGIPYDFSLISAPDKSKLMPDSNPMHLKLLFEKPTGRILGAQAVGKGDVTKRIDVIAAMISMNADLYDLKDLELCYSPPFSTTKDPVNIAASNALKLL